MSTNTNIDFWDEMPGFSHSSCGVDHNASNGFSSNINPASAINTGTTNDCRATNVSFGSPGASDLVNVHSFGSELELDVAPTTASNPARLHSFDRMGFSQGFNIESTWLDGIDDHLNNDDGVYVFTEHAVADTRRTDDLHWEAEAHTDDSWTPENVIEDWQYKFQEELDAFKTSNRWSFVVDPLSSRCRRLVHAMAHMKRFSHMSLGHGKLKRILISKGAIHATKKQRRWNQSMAQHTEAVIDPRIVTYRWLLEFSDSAPSSFGNVEKCLARAGIKRPSHFVDKGDFMWLIFNDPVDAASAVSIAPRYIDYTAFEACPWDPLEEVQDLSAGVEWRRTSSTGNRLEMEEKNRALSHSPRFRIAPESPLDGSPSNSPLIRPKPMSPFHYGEPPSPRPVFSGYVSSASNASHGSSAANSNYVSDAGSHKRRRLPPGHYECSFDGCDKIFKRAGERTKHEKVHQREFWPYQCDGCSRTFQYPKDVTRHQKSIGHGSSIAATNELKVLFVCVSLFEFNIEQTRREAGYPHLQYVQGELFDVVGQKGELWLAKNQDDATNVLGWIWDQHCLKLGQEGCEVT